MLTITVFCNHIPESTMIEKNDVLQQCQLLDQSMWKQGTHWGFPFYDLMMGLQADLELLCQVLAVVHTGTQ